MADEKTLSRIKLGSDIYYLADTWARQQLIGGISFEICWDGASQPQEDKIPAGVEVVFQGQTYTGSMPVTDAEPLTFYLVKHTRSTHEIDFYDEYAVVGEGDARSWEKIGSTQVDLKDLGALAFCDSIVVDKQLDTVLGTDTTFTNSPSNVNFVPQTTDVLGANSTFTNSTSAVSFESHTTASALAGDVTLTVPAQNATVENQVKSDFITEVTPTKQKLAQGTFQRVYFTVDQANPDMLVINEEGVVYATGRLESTDGQDQGNVVVSDVATNDAQALTSVGTATVVEKAVTKGNQRVDAITALGEATAAAQTITVGPDPEDPETSNIIAAYTGLEGTAAAQTITVGTNDPVGVAIYSTLGVHAVPHSGS